MQNIQQIMIVCTGTLEAAPVQLRLYAISLFYITKNTHMIEYLNLVLGSQSHGDVFFSQVCTWVHV